MLREILVVFLLDVSSIIYAKIAASMICVLHYSPSAQRELHSARWDSRHSGNEMQPVTYF